MRNFETLYFNARFYFLISLYFKMRTLIFFIQKTTIDWLTYSMKNLAARAALKRIHTLMKMSDVEFLALNSSPFLNCHHNLISRVVSLRNNFRITITVQLNCIRNSINLVLCIFGNCTKFWFTRVSAVLLWTTSVVLKHAYYYLNVLLKTNILEMSLPHLKACVREHMFDDVNNVMIHCVLICRLTAGVKRIQRSWFGWRLHRIIFLSIIFFLTFSTTFLWLRIFRRFFTVIFVFIFLNCSTLFASRLDSISLFWLFSQHFRFWLAALCRLWITSKYDFWSFRTTLWIALCWTFRSTLLYDIVKRQLPDAIILEIRFFWYSWLIFYILLIFFR